MARGLGHGISWRSQMIEWGKRNFQRRCGSGIRLSSVDRHHRNNSHFTPCVFILTKGQVRNRNLCLFKVI